MAEIDTLEVKIKANAQSAASSLNSLASALRSVKTALSSTNKDGVNVTQRMSKSINDLNNALHGLNTGGVTKLNALADAMRNYGDAMQRLKGVNGIKLSSSNLKAIEDALGVKNGTEVSSGGSANVDVGDELGDINDVVDAQWKKVKETTSIWTKFLKSIGRIALYRAIRSALKGVGEAFSEGLKNAYMYSKQSESFTRLAETMDRIKSTTSQMVNQIGAFWGELKQLMLPVIEWIVEKTRAAFEWLTEFFAALNGETTYLYANYVYTEWEKATDAVKDYKHQLLGLDELNVLSSDKSSAKDKEDYSKNYSEKNVRDSWLGLGAKMQQLKLAIGDIVPDFGNLTGDDVENILIVGLSGLTGGLIAGVPGAIVGTLAGILLTLGINSLTSDNGNKAYTKKGLFKVLRPALYGLAGAFIGFTTSGVKGAVIGMSIGATVGLVLEKLSSEGGNASYTKKGLFNVLKVGMGALTGAMLGYKVGGIKGAVLGLTTGATIELIINALSASGGNVGYTKSGLANLLKPALGGLVGGAIGFFLTKSASGAWLGAQIGISLSLLVQSLDIDWSGYDEGFLKGIKKDFKMVFPGDGEVIKSFIGRKAVGGVVNSGSLFYAGEAGPEFIGRMGNTSAVANTGQMTEAIYKAAYMGMSQALKENGGNGFGGFEPATTDDLFIAMRKKASNFNKRTGESAFA